MRIKLISLSLFLFIITGCTPPPSYQDKINKRPIPYTKQAKQKECSFIRQEIARMQVYSQEGAAKIATCDPKYGMCMGRIMMADASRNTASLESRAAQLQCGAAFSSTVVSNSGGSSIQECIQACKENTNRTSTQCFDKCNK